MHNSKVYLVEFVVAYFRDILLKVSGSLVRYLGIHCMYLLCFEVFRKTQNETVHYPTTEFRLDRILI